MGEADTERAAAVAAAREDARLAREAAGVAAAAAREAEAVCAST